MPYVKDNRTHYSTEDIEAAVTALVRDIKAKPKGWKYVKDAGTEFGIRYWAGPSQVRKARIRADRAAGEVVQTRYVGDFNSRLSSNVKILKKRDIDELQDDLSLLAAVGEEGVRLPSEVVAQVMAMGVYHLGLRPKGWKSYGARRRYAASGDYAKMEKKARKLVVSEGLTIRVNPKLAEPRVRRARTPEERAKYWKLVYTTGRQARKLEWRLKNDLLPALRQYELAWRETLPQLDRARAAGAEVEPHRNPAEFLRDLADQWEAEERI